MAETATTFAELRERILDDTKSILETAKALDQVSKSEAYTAILIEPRRHKAVKFVLQNLLDCLPAEWKIQFFHGPHHVDWVNGTLSTFTTAEQERITLKECPTSDFRDAGRYSSFIASRPFIEEIPTETFLIAQTDSMMNPNTKHMIHKFLQYDYIGAPWPWKEMPVGNGGFSIRKKSALLKVLDTYGPFVGNYEDQFFSRCLQNLGANLPSCDVAREFAVEQLFHPNPLAFHKVWAHMPTRFDDFCEVCPGLRTLKSLQGLDFSD